MKMSDMFDDPEVVKKMEKLGPHDPTKDENWKIVLELALAMDDRPTARGAMILTANELWGVPNNDVKRELTPILMIDVLTRALMGK